MAAARTIEAADSELGQVLSAAVTETMWARLLGLRGLEADDRYGHRLGLVVQHDAVRWADVLDALTVAAPLIEQLGHPLPDCARSERCGVCAAVRALPRLRARWMQTGLRVEDLGGPDLGGGGVGSSQTGNGHEHAGSGPQAAADGRPAGPT